MKGLIRKKAVLAKAQCGDTKLYEMIREGQFPPPIKLPGPNGKPGRTSYWSAEAVDEWISDRLLTATSAAVAARVNDPFGRRPAPSEGATSDSGAALEGIDA